MASLDGKVAVITGAASGIGFALATRAAQEGMRVVMADVEEEALIEATRRVAETGAKVEGVVTDVSVEASVQALAARAETTFGPVWLLCNNAGVASTRGWMWEMSHAEWEWLLAANLWGVIHGIQAFVPGMVARNEGYVVNTASIGGLLVMPWISPYTTSKHAVIGLSESLWHELAQVGSQVGVSVLCPGLVNTRILDSMRNWPGHLGPAPPTPIPDQADPARRMPSMEPDKIAEATFQAIASRQFWVIADLQRDKLVQRLRDRWDRLIEERNPVTYAFPPHYGPPHRS